ncbi:MAG: hypothetical protein M1409_08475, partial [Actinobacteria bacterium]|nr:hypothetical protein [Actinomycetota bacterium]
TGKKIQVSFILPAEKPIPINGSLSDWNPNGIFSGPITPDITDPQMMKRECAWVYSRWDEKNLYISDKVNDLTPLQNYGRLGRTWWYGDSLQVRLLMPSGPMPLGLYYDTPTKKNYIEKSYGGLLGYNNIISNLIGNSTNIEAQLSKEFLQGIGYTGTGAELQEQLYPNKEGYIMTAKIPWKYLDPHFSVKSGSIFRMGLQQNWNGVNVAQQSPPYPVIWGGGSLFAIPDNYAQAILMPESTSHAFAIVKVSDNTVKINGSFNSWPITDITRIEVSPKEKEFSGIVKACYSSKYLYIGYQVNAPMNNSGRDINTAFQTGAACEVYLSTNPESNPDRIQPVVGDYRIVMTNLGNKKPVVIAYIPVVQGEKQKYAVSAGWQAPLDKVEQIPQSKIYIKKNKNIYILQAGIPLKFLGIEPKPGFITQGDFAIDFSDSTGSHTALKLYWAERSSMMEDLLVKCIYFYSFLYIFLIVVSVLLYLTAPAIL